jgi:hypothetical protein
MRGDGVSRRSLELRGDLPGGRRELRIRTGSFTVVVAEIPGRSLNGDEWREIQRARDAYATMWGDHDPGVFIDDPLDGRGDSPHRAWHYRAYVTGDGGPAKLVVMRKVVLVPSELSEEQRSDPDDLLPVDIRFWCVQTDVGPVPLWDALRNHARRLAPLEPHPEFRIASISRAASPLGERRSPGDRERTAIGFAAIQILAAQGDPSLLYVCSLCPELRDRVTGLRSAGGTWVSPDFTRTEDVLGLPPNSVSLDNRLPVVQEHKTAFPGYFVHNEDAAQVIADLLDEGRITVEDLRWPTMRLLARESAHGADTRVIDELAGLVVEPDHRRLADVLTRPRLFQYLVPLIAGDRRLSRMSVADFRSRLLYETRDGPYSSTLVPAAWAASAWAVLEAADREYRARPPAPLPAVVPSARTAAPPPDLPAAAAGS